MPELDDKVYALDTRVSHMETKCSNIEIRMGHVEGHNLEMKNTVLNHMKQEEADRKEMNAKIDNILKYKWMIMGAMILMWLSSGNNTILKLIGFIQ